MSSRLRVSHRRRSEPPPLRCVWPAVRKPYHPAFCHSVAPGVVSDGIYSVRRSAESSRPGRIKQRLLCAACEALLSGWERETAERLFKPFHCDSDAVLDYGPWLAKFCASLCWRVLFIYRGLGLDHPSERQLQLVAQALDFWRDLMFDRRQHPGEFELHILPFAGALHFAEGFDPPPNMNRYFSREKSCLILSSARYC